jgi:histidinol phosphatase-like enzyme
MSKTKEKKNTKPSYDTDVIATLKELHGYTAHYIRMSIRGDRVGIMPEKIKKQYHSMANAALKAREEKLNQILNK